VRHDGGETTSCRSSALDEQPARQQGAGPSP
jgi:hypothetical protein